MITKQLPVGWKEVELGKLIKLRGGFAFSSQDFVNEGVSLIRISNFNNNEVDLKNSACVPMEFYGKYSELQLKENDLLIAMSGATTGKVGIVSKRNLPCLLNQRVGKFEILDSSLYWRYLNLFIKSKKFQDRIFLIAGGCAQPNISGKQIESVKIFLPPLPLQKKIVNTLEQAEALKQRREDADRLIDDYLKCVFSEMFLGKGFEEVELGSLTSKISSGSTPLGGNKNYLEEGEILFIRSQNVLMNKFSGHDRLYISRKIHENMKRTWVKFQDVLLNITGASIGRTAIYLGENDVANVNQHVCILRIENFEKLNPVYLNYYLSSRRTQNYIQKMNSGGTREALNFTQIKKFKIPLPSIALQKKFASIVEKVEKIKQAQKKSKQEITDLFGVLMQKAFREEMV